jgi:hypothetical protein
VEDLRIVVYVRLEVRLVMQVRDALFTGSVSAPSRPFLLSLRASVEILHKDVSIHYLFQECPINAMNCVT